MVFFYLEDIVLAIYFSIDYNEKSTCRRGLNFASCREKKDGKTP